VLAITAVCRPDICEFVAGEARVSGAVLFTALVSDTGGALHTVEKSADFSERIADKSITPGLTPIVSADIIDADAGAVSPGELKLTATAELQICAAVGESVNGLSSAGDEVFTQKEPLALSAMSGAADGSFTVSEEKEDREKPGRVLLSECGALITGVTAGADSVLCEGVLITTVTAETGDNGVRTLIFPTDFREEISCPGAALGDNAEAEASVVSCGVSIAETDDGALFKIDADIRVRAATYSREEREIVTDAFSLSHDLDITGESFNTVNLTFGKTYNEKIDGSAALGADMPYIDGVLAVCAGRLNIVKAVCGDGEIKLEGLLNCSVIYWNRETDGKNSVQVEIPYSLSLPAKDVTPAHTVSARGVITDLSARGKRGTEVDVNAAVRFRVHAFRAETGYCVKDIALGAERSGDYSAIAVHVARPGESLWDVAKSLCTTPELILKFNPELKVPIVGNERILVYRQCAAKI
jgi:hypothetical protein